MPMAVRLIRQTMGLPKKPKARKRALYKKKPSLKKKRKRKKPRRKKKTLGLQTLKARLVSPTKSF